MKEIFAHGLRNVDSKLFDGVSVIAVEAEAGDGRVRNIHRIAIQVDIRRASFSTHVEDDIGVLCLLELDSLKSASR